MPTSRRRPERKVVAVRVAEPDMLRVRFDEPLSVPDHLTVVEPDAVAGQADGALHVGLAGVLGIEERDDVAALDVAIRQNVPPKRSGVGVRQPASGRSATSPSRRSVSVARSPRTVSRRLMRGLSP